MATNLFPSTPTTPTSPLFPISLHRRRTSSSSTASLCSDSSFVSRCDSIVEALQDAEEELQNARCLMEDMDTMLHRNIARAIALGDALDKACQQLDDHDVYFEGRYPSPDPPTVDLWERKYQVENTWKVTRKENARVTKLTDSIKALPFKNNTYPKKFPRRLAGLLALSERQTEGLLYGYGQTPSGTLDEKRFALARFVGIKASIAQKRNVHQ